MSEYFKLAEGEEVVLRLRHHWFTFGQRVIFYAAFLAIPLILWWAQRRFFPDMFLDPTSFFYILTVLAMSAYFLFILQAFLVSWVEYALDVWIVTNQRIVNIVQSSLFHRTVSELSLDRVQDVTGEIKGVWATLFGYGTVVVETAGEQEHFEFETLPHPERITKSILDLSRAFEQKKTATGVPPPAKTSIPPQ